MHFDLVKISGNPQQRFAGKGNFVIVMKTRITLIGAVTSEVWVDGEHGHGVKLQAYTKDRNISWDTLYLDWNLQTLGPFAMYWRYCPTTQKTDI